MSQTYAQLQKQIAQLQAEAAELRRAEVAEVIAKVKEAIDAYGITVHDLFGAAAGRSAARGRSNGARAPKFGDGQGNEWGGRGPRPQWLRTAIAAGRSLAEFALDGAAPVPAPSRSGGAKSRAKRAARAKSAARRGEGRAALRRAVRRAGGVAG